MKIKGSGVWGSGNQDGESGDEGICGLRDEGMGLEVGDWRSGDQVIDLGIVDQGTRIWLRYLQAAAGA